MPPKNPQHRGEEGSIQATGQGCNKERGEGALLEAAEGAANEEEAGFVDLG
jgi:hypothetical protein